VARNKSTTDRSETDPKKKRFHRLFRAASTARTQVVGDRLRRHTVVTGLVNWPDSMQCTAVEVFMARGEARPARLWALPVLVAGLVGALLWLPILPALVVSGMLALAGVVAFGRPTWRVAALLVAALLLGFSAVETFCRSLVPPPLAVNHMVVKTYEPPGWIIDDPELGYRPRPAEAARVEARYGDELVFRQTYTIDAWGGRATPGSRDHGPTYLFIGDSFMFGEGLADAETLPAQFAARLPAPAHVANLAALGYGPNHLVRALETGLYDRHAAGKVAAVFTWIHPVQLPRVTGDADWLNSSPRYTLDASGQPRHTGSFAHHRQQDPLAEASYWARGHLTSVARVAAPLLDRERSALYVALIGRLRDLVRARYDAPLVVLYDWPDRDVPGQNDRQYIPAFRALQALGIPLLPVRKVMGPVARWHEFVIPHDGHPNSRLTAGLAAELTGFLAGADLAR
jgi:hypothetical protein